MVTTGVGPTLAAIPAVCNKLANALGPVAGGAVVGGTVAALALASAKSNANNFFPAAVSKLSNKRISSAVGSR